MLIYFHVNFSSIKNKESELMPYINIWPFDNAGCGYLDRITEKYKGKYNR